MNEISMMTVPEAAGAGRAPSEVGWQKTWLYGWLVKNAADYGFFQLKTETWHWEYHEGKPSPSCYPGDAPISSRPVPPQRKS